MGEAALEGIIVVELGTRVGVGVCGSLLRQLGATVVLVERSGPGLNQNRKALNRRQLSAGKLSFAPQPDSTADLEMLQRLLSEVLDDPARNTREHLLHRVREYAGSRV